MDYSNLSSHSPPTSLYPLPSHNSSHPADPFSGTGTGTGTGNTSRPTAANPPASKGGSRFESISDLTDLHPASIAEDTLLATLRERYLSSSSYTRLSACGLVSINPYRSLEENGEETLQAYAGEEWYDEPTGDAVVSSSSSSSSLNQEKNALTLAADGTRMNQLPPHIFQLAIWSYYHMRRTGQDQSLLLSGETGSGKSELTRLASKAILSLSLASSGKKGSKLASQIPNAQFILESFGHARTHANGNASKVGKYIELQFNENGRLVGAKTLAYYLEKNRSCGTPPIGERNFHAFYYLVAGASEAERAHLMLGDASAYRYLGNRHGTRPDGHSHGYSKGNGNGGDGSASSDATRFNQLKEAFKAVGLSKRLVAQICQLIAAILHLGNLEFTNDRNRNEVAAVVKNTDTLNTVADFLAVPASSLEALFSYRSKMIKKELCTVFLDTDGAAANRDELSKTLYSLLFTWLNEYINQKLCKDDFASFIGILDLPGSTNLSGGSRTNSLDQFCVNYADERLQNWILQRVFHSKSQEFTQEGLIHLANPIAFFDNSECLRVIDNQPGGLIHITDDQARQAPRKTEHTMIEAFAKRWGNHDSFKVGAMDRTGFPTFTISHYAGPVTYSTEDFLEKNADAINPDFVSLFRGAHPEAGGPSHHAHAHAHAHTGATGTGSSNPFIQGLFTGKSIVSEAHPQDDETIVAAQQPVKPLRAPSVRRKGSMPKRLASVGEEATEYGDTEDAGTTEAGGGGGGNHDEPSRGIRYVLGEFRSSLDMLFQALDDTQPWYIFCLNPNDAHLPNQVETRGLRAQIRSLGLPEITKKLQTWYEVSMTHQEGCERYADELNGYGILHGGQSKPADAMVALAKAKNWQEKDMTVGKYKVFLSHRVFHALEDPLRFQEPQDQFGHQELEVADPFSPHPRGSHAQHQGSHNVIPESESLSALPLVHHAAGAGDEDYDDYDVEGKYPQDKGNSRYGGETASFVGTEQYAPSRNMFSDLDKNGLAYPVEKEAFGEEVGENETVEEMKVTASRKRWVFLTNALTWWIPGFLLSWIGGLKRPDIRQAWREKLTINLIIWFICGCAVFVIAILGNIICPREYVYSAGELSSHSFDNNPDDVFVTIRGEVFDLSSLGQNHLTVVPVVPTKSIMKYGGLDASNIFPVQVSALCDGVDGTVSPWVTLDSTNTSDPNAQYHDFRAFTNDSRPDWYYEQMTYMRYRYRVGFMGHTSKEIKNMASSGRAVAIYNGLVYELTTYVSQGGGGVHAPTGYNAPADTNRQFMSQEVVTLFQQQSGKDITQLLDGLSSSIGADTVARQKACLRNLFVIGKVDNRNSPACQFSKYILLVLSIVMVSIIGFKFLGAIHFGSARAPENHDKFIICQVPCYTEGEESLRKTIDSLARLKYDDKRKLILVICDGNIVGSGNDRPTPRIVLDILGVDPNQDAEALSFLSLGEGTKQHNMGKVYSGLYECAGHVVPYLVVVKVGKPSERQRPGNRGKRDSQMTVMHFLNKVHFDSPMNPLELEMFHQIKNVIGVNPTFYEFVFTVDADTTVDTLSLNRLVSHMVHDKKTIAVCGETELANAKQSLVTMMQVYEYFISHHLAKSFESLFGSITCLPGCFSMYRLRTPDTHKPLFISNEIIEGYSENRVDTLHMKNLLHLGEDRYLTTLILKHFPTYKTKFVRDAHAFTVAPDDWRVLMSQRRRWINSTIHNLVELSTLEGLCGFCCFSMRFIVLIDLVSTIIAPVTVAYIGYLIYLVAAKGDSIPTISIIMLAAIYGLQMLIFIFRLRWDMIAWMLFYILAIPVFSFALPLYSFWKMDDFSWGSTRVVLSDKGSKVVIHDEGKFDPRVIPLKSWNEYENELWDQESNHSVGSWVPPSRKGQPAGGAGGYADSRAQSLYGRETVYDGSFVGGGSGGGYGQYADEKDGYADFPRSRGMSPSPSQQRLTQSRPPSAYHDGGGRSTSYYNTALDSPARSGGPRSSSMYFNASGLPSSNSQPFNPYTDAPRGGPPGGTQRQSSYLPEYSSSGPVNLLAPDMITDSEIESEIRRIVSGADLDTLTKKGVRKQLEGRFGVDLSGRKEVINGLIERVLVGECRTALSIN